jgi:anti-sigma factor ChrR (cupin superfamily)
VRDHPDREQLAAWQAGELGEPDRGRTAAHLAGCGACASVVTDLERARQGLATLVEPDLPAGGGGARGAEAGTDGHAGTAAEPMALAAGHLGGGGRLAAVRGRRCRAGQPGGP